MRVEQLLSSSAARFGHKTAVVAGRAAHSYAELDRKSDRLAAALTGRGVKRGDRIAAYLDTSFAAVVTAFGVLKAGAALCPVETAIRAEAFAGFLNESGAAGIVTEARLASKAAAALCDAPAVKLVVLVGGDRTAAAGSCLSFEDVVGRLGGAAPAPAGGDADPAIVLNAAGIDRRGGIEEISHADVIAESLIAAGGDAMPTAPSSIASRAGLCRLVAEIGAGATVVLSGPTATRAPLFARADFADIRLAIA
jgi:acyl-CoA synthetase (AMP-forming)/AMP-acid ligase II